MPEGSRLRRRCPSPSPRARCRMPRRLSSQGMPEGQRIGGSTGCAPTFRSPLRVAIAAERRYFSTPRARGSSVHPSWAEAGEPSTCSPRSCRPARGRGVVDLEAVHPSFSPVGGCRGTRCHVAGGAPRDGRRLPARTPGRAHEPGGAAARGGVDGSRQAAPRRRHPSRQMKAMDVMHKMDAGKGAAADRCGGECRSLASATYDGRVAVQPKGD